MQRRKPPVRRTMNVGRGVLTAPWGAVGLLLQGRHDHTRMEPDGLKQPMQQLKQRNSVKKLLLRLIMIGGFATVATGQGTIQFNNSVLTRVRDLDGQPMSVPFNVAVYFSTAPGLWQGPGQPIGRSLATSPGVFTAPNGSFAYQLPGTEGGQVVSLQFYAWTAAQGDDPYLAWLSGARTAITEAEQFILGSLMDREPSSGPQPIRQGFNRSSLISGHRPPRPSSLNHRCSHWLCWVEGWFWSAPASGAGIHSKTEPDNSSSHRSRAEKAPLKFGRRISVYYKAVVSVSADDGVVWTSLSPQRGEGRGEG
jgi:hypothetical protein